MHCPFTNHRFRFTNSFVKDSTTLISGNVVAQGIAFGSYFLLTRLYSPEVFGLLNIFYSYIEVLIIASTCKYELATVVADNEREASAVAHFALRMNTFVSILLLCIILICKLMGWHVGKLGNGSITLLIPPMVFFSGTTRVYASLYNRFRAFSTITASNVTGAVGAACLKIFLGLSFVGKGLHNLGLSIGTVVGQAAANISYLLRLKKLNLPKKISQKEMLAAARHHRRFAFFTAPKEFVNSLSANLPLIYLPIALSVDNAQVGLFALAYTFALRPVNLINNAFEQALYVRLSERVRAQQPMVHDLFRFLGVVNLIALPVVVVGFLFAEPIMTWCFGNEWNGCGIYMRCLIPFAWLQLSATSLSCIANVFSRQRVEFLFFMVLFVLRIIALSIGIAHNSFILAIALFALAGCCLLGILLAWYIRLAIHHDHSLMVNSD